jgi:hypothetical protein
VSRRGHATTLLGFRRNHLPEINLLGISAERLGFAGLTVKPLLDHARWSVCGEQTGKRHFAICHGTINNRRGVALRQILTKVPVVVRFMSVEHQSYFSSSRV